ncbi:hypothetical protein NITGR_720031 [Nitrospina gracilis 3/211]|uniref:Uncharacterized protein n=1 Tax=Nitrospina gracilis (strain 3/211) TaxID=1266370 RepID=M1ZDI7_NITG3|nr:hypothetical protein NITGR_720031 [Nitrospina gracilis 3/211]
MPIQEQVKTHRFIQLYYVCFSAFNFATPYKYLVPVPCGMKPVELFYCEKSLSILKKFLQIP